MASALHPAPEIVRFQATAPPPLWPGLAQDVLDMLREAVLVLGRHAHLLGSNRNADALLAERDGLALAAGCVVGSTPEATRALLASVERAVHGAAGSLRMPRASRPPLALRVEPHPQAAGSSAAVVFASEALPWLRDDELDTRFGLTPAECRVVQLLCTGAPVAGVARELEISCHTVRGHLKQVFGKTGTHRQAELICKLLSDTSARPTHR